MRLQKHPKGVVGKVSTLDVFSSAQRLGREGVLNRRSATSDTWGLAET